MDKRIQTLARHSYEASKPKTFKDQIIDYRLGKIPTGELLIVEKNPNRWNIQNVDFADKFVVIKQSYVDKILND